MPNFKGNEMMGPTWECLGFIEQITLVCSWGVYSCDIQELPPFKPNDFMFEKFADKGNSKAEIFAWAVRDVVSKVSGLPKADQQARDKAIYKNFITGKTDEIEYNGKKFTAPPIPSIFPCLRKKKKPKTENSKP